MPNKQPQLLLVEDDINLGFVTKDNLERKGYRVTHVTDGQQALETWKDGRFDLCILDVMLPRLDGFTLARHIRRADSQVPILFLTAKSLTEDKIEGLALGADDYLTKPFSMEELLLRISVFLRRSKVYDSTAGTAAGLLQLGSVIFDPSALSLSISGKSTRLTQKEADLLQYLITHQGKLLKREEILNNLWGDDDYFMGRSLDVFISRLRKYLRPEPGIRIENVHGVGFQLVYEGS